jgi:hypothetical protein
MAKKIASASNVPNPVSGKTIFKDPIAIKSQHPDDMPIDGKNSPWDFRCPQYDQRSSNFVNAGTHYGIGHRQPVGHEGNPVAVVSVLPRTRVQTLRDDDLG